MNRPLIPDQRRPRVKVDRAEQFARLLEVRSAAAAIEAADSSVLPLLTLTKALRSADIAAGPGTLPDASRAAMRQRLVAMATVQQPDVIGERLRSRKAATAAHRLHRRLVAMAGSVVVITSFAGVGVAAARSLPGNPFYDVKRATEAVQLWTARGEVAKGHRHLEFARTRLVELQKLSPNSSHITSTLAAMNAQTRDGSSDLLAAYRSSHSTQPLADLVTFADHQAAGLVALSKRLPASLRPAEVPAVSVLSGLLRQVQTTSGQSCLSCLVAGARKPAPTNGGGTPAHPSSPAPSGSAPSPQPTKSASTPGGRTTSPTAPNSPSPSGLLPTGLVPTTLIPSLPALLHPKGHGKTTPRPLPVISSLIKSLHL